MNIAKHSVVQISYTLRGDNESGEVIETVPSSDPLTFLYGVGSMLPVFEKNLLGLGKGDAFKFALKSADAYGEHNPEAVVDLDKSIFVIDGKLATEMIGIGKIVNLRDDQGNPHRAVILEVGEDTVKADFNHPMAGRNLHFTGAVVDVRKATETEISHGHVHGPGGHQH